jgi:hypothetical protein
MSLSNIKRGMVFAGCSYTWGQGLYFYSNMPNLDYTNANLFTSSKITNAHIRYKDAIRFPRLVANHFETFEIVKPENGGSDEDSINFINNVFELKINKVPYDKEISHIIFQTSDLNRNQFHFNYKNTNHKIFLNPKNEILYEWMVENNYDFYGLIALFKEQVFLKIKELFVKYEQRGIICKILCWQDDYVSLIKTDPFFDGKFINFDYKNKTYDCIDELIKTNEGMSIHTDIVNLNKVIGDEHPSKQCHRLIADSIIKHLENNNI